MAMKAGRSVEDEDGGDEGGEPKEHDLDVAAFAAADVVGAGAGQAGDADGSATEPVCHAVSLAWFCVGQRCAHRPDGTGRSRGLLSSAPPGPGQAVVAGVARG